MIVIFLNNFKGEPWSSIQYVSFYLTRILEQKFNCSVFLFCNYFENKNLKQTKFDEKKRWFSKRNQIDIMNVFNNDDFTCFKIFKILILLEFEQMSPIDYFESF